MASRLGEWTFAWCSAFSFGLTLVLVLALRWAAPRVGMVDRGERHRSRMPPTPLLGGVGVYLGVVVAYLVFAQPDRRALWPLVGAGAMLVLGLLDDRVGLRARFRLAVQLLGATAIVAAGVYFDWFPWPALNYAVTVVWLVGMMNALNCLDCADGSAAGVAAIAAAAFCLIALAHGQTAVALLAVALLGSCTAFLAFNFPPASIFLGDAGSTFLGFLLGVLAIASSAPAADASPLAQAWMAALPLGVPVWDIVLVHLRRYWRGTRSVRALLESKGSDHLPHRLLHAGLAPSQAALTVYLIAGLLAIPAVVVARHGSGALTLAVEVALLGLIAGERPFGALVGKAGRILNHAAWADECPVAVEETLEVEVQPRVAAAAK